jgi:ribonuclease G
VVSAGREILVQVTKEAIGGKGPRVTAQISFAGQRLVFLPASPHRAVSRRIEPEEERERLRLLLAALPGEGGFIARTAATGSGPRELEAEAEEIRERWEEVRRRADTAPVPSCVHEEIDLALRVLRDFAGADLERVVVDREEAHRRCREHAERYLPGLAPRIERFEGVSPIFEAFGVERELQRALRRRVWLPSGGYIVIHPTEALVAIDVNTGKYVGKRRFEETALQTNVEAAREIVRQIRLRDLGGILVIDFIDLEEDESRRQLAAALEAELKADRAKSRVLQISEFGLVEITRQRVRPSLESRLTVSCPSCRGSGRVLSPATLGHEIRRELEKRARHGAGERLVVRARPDVLGLLQELLEAPGQEGERRIPACRLEPAEDFGPEQYEITSDAG